MKRDIKSEVTGKILDAYLKGGLSQATDELVQGWLADQDGSGIKDEELRKRFFTHVKPNRNPGKSTVASLTEVQRILGFPDSVQTKKVHNLRRHVAFRVAAVVLPLFMITGAMIILISRRSGYESLAERGDRVVVTTAEGERKELTLADGTKIWLGENSMVEYCDDLTGDRVVNLNGEAFFSVARLDGGQPFGVKADSVTVNVLGTEFLVKMDADNGLTEVTLSSGKVAVAHERSDVVYHLLPNERLVLDHVTLEAVRSVVSDEYTEAHKTTKPLTSPILPLDEVFAIISNTYNIKFNIDAAVSAGTKIKISVDDSLPLEELLSIIGAVAEPSFNFRIADGTVFITR